LKKRYLDKSKMGVSILGLGCMGMSWAYGKSDDKESIATIHLALDLGVTFFDTSDMYGNGENERLLAKAFKEKRSQAIIATKFGVVRTKEGGSVNGRPEYVREACHASLKRLLMDYVDLYYLHRVDPNTPIEETVGAMSELVKEGKARFIGLSEASAQTIRRANSVHPITALQSEYSLWSRDVEEQILPTCRELGIGFVPYSPLGRGFLTGRFQNSAEISSDDNRRNHPRFQEENFKKNIELVKTIEGIAQGKDCTASQISLAWVLAQGEDIVPIPGTKQRKYLRENIDSIKIELSDEDMAELNSIAENVHGNRYNDDAMRRVNI